MTHDPITLNTRLTRADVAGLIEALVESMKEGCLKVQKSDACCTLDVPRVVDLEVEAGEKGDRTVFRIEVSWRTNPPEIPDETETAPQKPAAPRRKSAAPAKTASTSGKTASKAADKSPAKNAAKKTAKSAGKSKK